MDGPTKLDGVEAGDQSSAMREASSAPGLVAPAVMEFLGCFIFIYTICFAVQAGGAGTAAAPLAIGGVLMVLIYMGGHISGGHFNPAVSLGIFIRDDGFGIVNMAVYMVAQVLGGILGGIVAYMVYEGDDADWGARIEPNNGYDEGAAFINELIFTFLLVSTVLNVATSTAPAYQNNSFFALAIGFSVVAGATAGGGISGGAYNPAVAFGVTTASAMGSGTFKYIWLYLIAELLGGALAAVLYKFVFDRHLASLA